MGAILEMSQKAISRHNAVVRVEGKSITQMKAAELLGISDRQFRRLWKAYQEQGATGLISKQRGRPSNNRLPDSLKKRVLKLLRERYVGFGPKFAHEKLLEDHELEVSRETVRKWMMEAGLWESKKRPKLRSRA